jgi:hypothetical protein
MKYLLLIFILVALIVVGVKCHRNILSYQMEEPVDDVTQLEFQNRIKNH